MNEILLANKIADYQQNFVLSIWENTSKVNLQAISQFQKNWNIDASDFADMLSKSLMPINLLESSHIFARKMIIHFARHDSETVRNMFIKLFDEDENSTEINAEDVCNRILAFQESSKILFGKYPGNRAWSSAYQDPKQITVYLWLRYPDKYYIYKPQLLRDVADKLQCDEYDFKYTVSVKERLKNCWGLYDKICNKVKEYTGLTDMITSYISDCDDCYNDPTFKTLTMDICQYIQSSRTGTLPETENQPEIFVPEDNTIIGNADEYVKFKKLLKFYITKWRTNLTVPKGSGSFGQGYRMPSIHKQYEEWCHYDGFSLDCSFMGGGEKMRFSSGNYIQWECINLYFEYDKVFDENGEYDMAKCNIKSIYIDFYDHKDLAEPFKPFQHYSVQDLDLFSDEEPNSQLKQLFNEYKNVIIQVMPAIKARQVETEASSNDEISKDNNDENADDIRTESEKPISGDSSADTHMPIETVVNRITGGYNAIFYGVPGCGKSYHIEHNILTDGSGKSADKKYIERIVFYPDYTYSDFVGQITPTLKDNHVNYEFVHGPFTRILKKANDDPEHMYYLVIEEINRGNAAAIFGDIFQLLDRDKDGTSEYTITNVDINENEQIEIPSNLTILATMNTSDQNVYTLDTAFQRRWEMHLIPNELGESDPLNNKEILDTGVLWKNFYKIINESIATLQCNQGLASTEDKRIGAHFVKEDDLKEADKFEKVISYLWNDAFKMDRPALFDENFKEFEKVILAFKGKSGIERFDIFKKGIIKKLKNESVIISNDEQAPASEESNGDN